MELFRIFMLYFKYLGHFIFYGCLLGHFVLSEINIIGKRPSVFFSVFGRFSVDNRRKHTKRYAFSYEN